MIAEYVYYSGAYSVFFSFATEPQRKQRKDRNKKIHNFFMLFILYSVQHHLLCKIEVHEVLNNNNVKQKSLFNNKKRDLVILIIKKRKYLYILCVLCDSVANKGKII
jgi:hypothetical protein